MAPYINSTGAWTNYTVQDSADMSLPEGLDTRCLQYSLDDVASVESSVSNFKKPPRIPPEWHGGVGHQASHASTANLGGLQEYFGGRGGQGGGKGKAGQKGKGGVSERADDSELQREIGRGGELDSERASDRFITSESGSEQKIRR